MKVSISFIKGDWKNEDVDLFLNPKLFIASKENDTHKVTLVRLGLTFLIFGVVLNIMIKKEIK